MLGTIKGKNTFEMAVPAGIGAIKGRNTFEMAVPAGIGVIKGKNTFEIKVTLHSKGITSAYLPAAVISA
ncbi:hypothetical protein D3C76_201540 [compost metagenome]